jgi:cytochrome c peroxidase
MSETKVELGRYLFYDTRLSADGKFSCATCHQQARAFADDKGRGVGITGQVHPRGPMSLTNVAYLPVLTWANPEVRALETQALVPMLGDAPIELGMGGKEALLLDRVKAEPVYQRLFPQAFPGERDPFSIVSITRAIASFERTLLSGGSPYDRYRTQMDLKAVSGDALIGEDLFFNERASCFRCHGGFNFTNTVDYAGKAVVEIEFHNTGLYNIDGRGGYPASNTGTRDVTRRDADMGRFRAPTLRNIALTAPYMHDGSIATLEGVIRHYEAGGRTIADGQYKGVGSASPLKSAFVKGFSLTQEERRGLVAFLNSLTDTAFTTDPRFANPWPR